MFNKDKSAILKFKNAKSFFLKHSDVFISLIATTLVFALTAIFGSFIYEKCDEITVEQALRGVFWNTPVTNTNFAYRGISHFFVFLYENVKININYFGFSLVILNAIAYWILIYLLLKNIKKHVWFFIIFFVFITYQNIYLVSLTRVSILASFAGLALFLFSLGKLKNRRFYTAVVIAFLIIFYAYFVRPTGCILSYILITPFIFNFLFFTKIKQNKYKILLIIIPFFLALFIEKLLDEKAYDDKVLKKQTEILDYGFNYHPENMEQEKALFLTKKWFLADTDVNKTLCKLTKKHVPENKNIGLLKNKQYYVLFDRIIWQLKTYVLNPIKDINPLMLIVTLLFILCSIFIINKNFYKTIFFVIVTGFYYSIITYMYFFMKYENRVIIPTLSIFFFFVLMFQEYIFETMNNKIKRTLLIFSSAIVIMGSVFQYVSYKKDYKNRQSEAIGQLDALNNFNKVQNQDIVFLTFVSPGYNYYALKHIEINKNKLQIPLIKWISWNKNNQMAFKQLTDSEKIEDLIIWIAKNPMLASIYSCPEENENLKQVFKYYNMDVDFIAKNIMYSNGDGFYYIKIKHLK